MVLGAPCYPDSDASGVRLLPPGLALPLLLPRSQASSRSQLVVKPRASADAASSPPPSSGPASDASSSVSSSSSLSGGSWTARIGFPWPSAGMSLGMGAGGALFFGGVPPSKANPLWPFTGRRGRGSCGGKERARKRILIMMSNTGGGHRASAEAIKAAFQEKYGDEYEILIEDMWKDHCPDPFNKLPDTYSFMVKHSFLWWASYQILQPRWVHVPYLRAVHMVTCKMLGEYFDAIQPDLVVSVHPLMQHVPIRILKSRIRSGLLQPVNFATVVTDFTTCHNTWFHPDVTKCFVPTEFCKSLALKNGLKESQIIMHGLPIRPVFSKPLPSKPALKARLKLDKHLPAVLLIGGGEGMGKLEETVDRIADNLGGQCQVVVICGRNRSLLERLQAKSYDSGLKVTACGFINNIHEYMGACDMVITKAGPGTMAEALIAGLPIMLNGFVPGQEEGNIPYVIENKVGAFETSPAKIAEILGRWLGPERQEFDAMSRRSKALGRPEAVYKIVEDLARLAYVPDFTCGPAKAHHLATTPLQLA